MKPYLLFIAVAFAYILMPKNASAQYKSILGENSTSWTGFRYCGGVDISDTFFIENDTIIQSRKYKKIMVNSINNEKIVYGFLREDTLIGSIWFKYAKQDTAEKLIMNLNLQLGDSFSIYYYDVQFPNNLITDTIIVDSIYYLNGLKNIRFDVPLACYMGEGNKFTFMEGIGPNAIFGYTGRKSGVENALICYFKDSVKYYSFEGMHGECSIFNTSINEKISDELNNLKLYPNPTQGNGIITFQNNKNTCVNLYIYDLNGKQVYSNSSNTSYISFDINASEKGIYIYKLQNEKGEFASGRIVKQ